jgi:hypothetical protein
MQVGPHVIPNLPSPQSPPWLHQSSQRRPLRPSRPIWPLTAPSALVAARFGPSGAARSGRLPPSSSPFPASTSGIICGGRRSHLRSLPARPGVVHARPALSKPALPRGRARPRRMEVGCVAPSSRPARRSPPSARPAPTLPGGRLLWPELAALEIAAWWVNARGRGGI